LRCDDDPMSALDQASPPSTASGWISLSDPARLGPLATAPTIRLAFVRARCRRTAAGTMMEGGEPERVLEMRRGFQRLMRSRYSDLLEELTGRKLLAFLSQAHVEPDLTVEMFLMDGPAPGFGALELVDPGAA
jgi:hypothetical protein